MKATEPPKDRALDSQLALSLIGRDAPHDLIVNRDFITRIGNLCDVGFVRKLNISFNQIRSLDGVDQMPQLRQLFAYACDLDKIECIKTLTKVEMVMLQQNRIPRMGDAFSGLAKLQELRLDQNKIAKIEFLSGCVSLRKLDLSFNNIESLTGLSGLQQLQELKVSNNLIKTLAPLKALPSIKDLDVSNNQLKSLEGLNQLPTLEYLRADHNHIAELKMSPFLGANKKESKDKATDKKTASAKKPSGALSEIADLSGPMLVELSLSGNRIRSVEGLEVFKENLENVDLSANNLAAADVSRIANTLAQCTKLTEFRMHTNPICSDEGALNHLVAALTEACPALRAVDGLAIVANTDMRAAKSTSNHTSLQALLGDLPTVASLVGGEFHTWNDDATATDNTSVGAKDTQKDDLSESGDSDSEKEPEGEKPAEEKRYPHNLALQEMLTPEQIIEKEESIRNVIKYCKERLEASARTVFGFVDATQEKESIPFRARRLLPPTTASESGARVAAALEEAESASRKHSLAPVAEAAPVAAAAVTSSAAAPAVQPTESKPSSATSMKEKLVDRVRMAVSSSVGVLPMDSAGIATTGRPTTMEAPRKTTANTAVLADERPAFNPDNYFNFPDEKPSAHVLAAQEAPSKQASNSPGQDSKSVHSMQSHSKVKTTASAATSATVLGSGLTRYGTKVKPLAGQSHAIADAPTFFKAGETSPLRAHAADPDSLDILNLKITKPSHHVYMTEWDEAHAADPRLYPRSAESDSDAEEDSHGDTFEHSPFREHFYEDEQADGERGQVEQEEDLVEPEYTSEIVGTTEPIEAPQVYHEVRLRPDDRFGKAVAAYGGAGYDKRGVRRGSEPTTQSSDDAAVGDKSDLQAGEVAVLRRSYSAPKMEKPSTVLLQVSTSADSKAGR